LAGSRVGLPREGRLGGSPRSAIADELYILLERLDADEELLSIIGSWYDIFDDAEVLALLREYRQGRVIHQREHVTVSVRLRPAISWEPLRPVGGWAYSPQLPQRS
jgi:hypothetical protein